MRIIVAAIALLLLAGCAVSSLIPSIDACDELAYYRKGDTAAIQAVCKVR